MLNPDASYREALKEEYAARCRNNRRYSLRAFSRFLEMPSAQLSDVLNEKYGISAQKASRLAKRLGYSKRETELFCTLVEKEHSRSKVRREAAALKLEKFRNHAAPGSYSSLEQDYFDAISGWFHFPIVELTRIDGFVGDPAWISKRLGISTIEADLAINRLIRIGLLKRADNTLVACQDFYGSTSQVPSEARRNFHRQVLERAVQALVLQPYDRRDFSATVLAVDSSKIAKVRELAEEFRLKVDAFMQTRERKDAVFCLSVQFFNIGESDVAK